jgi:hypothetical protein
MEQGDRTFGILLIIGALAGGWMYNTGRLSAVWQAIQGRPITGAKGTPEQQVYTPTVIQPLTPAYGTPIPNQNPPTVQAGPGVPVPPALQFPGIPNTLQSWLNPNAGGSYYAA